MQTSEFQELLLDILPQWHCHIIKPFKRLLNEKISLEMYYCIQILRRHENNMTMSELARWARMPKQQMTKIINSLVEQNFVERVDDPCDRRIIRLRITEKANDYINNFLEKDAVCFRKLYYSIDDEDRDEFTSALETIHRILGRITPPIDDQELKT